MDLRLYYSKIRDAESKLADEFPVLVSRETPDGGKKGIFTEVPRPLAARMIVNGAADVASPEDAKAFRELQAEAKLNADKAAEASRVQFVVMPTADLARMKGE